MKRLLLAAVVAVALLSGCASSTSTGVSRQAAATLKPYVEAVRTAANGKSLAAVRAAVTALDAEVERLVTSQAITTPTAQAIENQAGTVQSVYANANPTPKPSTTPTTPSPSVTPTTATPTPTVTVTVTPTITPSTPATTPPTSPSSGTKSR
jgi:hypothetical protein